MTGNIWIDLELSLADVEAELPDMSGELPAYRMGQRGLKGAIDNALNLNLISGRSRAVSSVATWPFPDASVDLAG
jgi:hypothetical protein